MQEGHIPLWYCLSDLVTRLRGISVKVLLKLEYLKALLEWNGEEA